MPDIESKLEVIGYSTIPDGPFVLLPSAKFSLGESNGDYPYVTMEFEAYTLEQFKDILDEVVALQLNSLLYFRISTFRFDTESWCQISIPQQAIVYREDRAAEFDNPARPDRFVITIQTACIKEPQWTCDPLKVQHDATI